MIGRDRFVKRERNVFSRCFRDETFEILHEYHWTIVQYVLVIYDGFKDVLEDVSSQQIGQ